VSVIYRHSPGGSTDRPVLRNFHVGARAGQAVRGLLKTVVPGPGSPPRKLRSPVGGGGGGGGEANFPCAASSHHVQTAMNALCLSPARWHTTPHHGVLPALASRHNSCVCPLGCNSFAHLVY